jgi:hypothetical protein
MEILEIIQNHSAVLARLFAVYGIQASVTEDSVQDAIATFPSFAQDLSNVTGFSSYDGEWDNNTGRETRKANRKAKRQNLKKRFNDKVNGVRTKIKSKLQRKKKVTNTDSDSDNEREQIGGALSGQYNGPFAFKNLTSKAAELNNNVQQSADNDSSTGTPNNDVQSGKVDVGAMIDKAVDVADKVGNAVGRFKGEGGSENIMPGEMDHMIKDANAKQDFMAKLKKYWYIPVLGVAAIIGVALAIKASKKTKAA